MQSSHRQVFVRCVLWAPRIAAVVRRRHRLCQSRGRVISVLVSLEAAPVVRLHQRLQWQTVWQLRRGRRTGLRRPVAWCLLHRHRNAGLRLLHGGLVERPRHFRPVSLGLLLYTDWVPLPRSRGTSDLTPHRWKSRRVVGRPRGGPSTDRGPHAHCLMRSLSADMRGSAVSIVAQKV